MRACPLALALLVIATMTGCGNSAVPPPDYSNKPDPSNPKPYVPKNHKAAIEVQNAGPKQPNPRTKGKGT